MKTSKLTKFSTKNNVKKLTTKQKTKVSGKGGIGSTVGVMGIGVDDLEGMDI